MSAADSYQVWTDGACSKNPGEGGWAFVIQQQQKSLRDCLSHYRYQHQTTFC